MRNDLVNYLLLGSYCLYLAAATRQAVRRAVMEFILNSMYQCRKVNRHSLFYRIRTKKGHLAGK